MANWPFGKLQAGQASSFRIEFICYVDGYPEPEVVETVEGVFKNLQAAIDEGERLSPSVRRQKRIDGFRVAQGAGPWIAHRFRGEPWFREWSTARSEVAP